MCFCHPCIAARHWKAFRDENLTGHISQTYQTMGINAYRDHVSEFDVVGYQKCVDIDKRIHQHVDWLKFEKQCELLFESRNAIPKVALEFPSVMCIAMQPR